jgi:hypothetical protein
MWGICGDLRIETEDEPTYFIKVKFSLSLIKHHVMKTCGGVEVPLYTDGRRPWYPLDWRLSGPQSSSEVPNYEDVWWSGGTTLHRGRRPWYPLDWRLSGPQSWSEGCGEEKQIWLLTDTELRFLGCPTPSLVITPTELSRLQFEPCHVVLWHLQEGPVVLKRFRSARYAVCSVLLATLL